MLIVAAVASLSLRAQTPAPAGLPLFPLRALWTLPLDSVLTAPPAFEGSRGFFPLEERRLIAYELLDGTPLWTAAVAPQSRPTPGGNQLFIAEDGGITALNADTGATLWHVPVTDGLSTPLVWDNGWLAATTADGTVLAFRARDGQLVWHQQLPAAATGAVAFAADRVYVPAKDGHVYALQVQSGQVLWNHRIGGTPGDMAATDDRVYVGSTDNNLYCLLSKDGSIDWRWTTGGDIVGTPVIADGRVYFASLDNLLRALDQKSGAQIWKRVLAIRPTRGPVAAGSVVFMSGNTVTSPAFNMKTGLAAGELTTEGLLFAAPHFVDNHGLPFVVAVSRDVAKGAVVKALIRSIDPAVAAIAPLPNPIMPDIPREATSTGPMPAAPR